MKAGAWYTSTLYARIGETGSGVPVLFGRWRRPPLWYCVGALLQAANMVLFGAGLGIVMRLRRSDPLDFLQPWFQPLEWLLAVTLLGLGAAMLWRSAWLLGVRRQLRRLTPAYDLAAQFGTDAETLERVARKSEIRPAYRINGVDYYDRANFANAATLLRPAGEPQSALLRPAASTDRAPEQLLRAANGTDEE